MTKKEAKWFPLYVQLLTAAILGVHLSLQGPGFTTVALQMYVVRVQGTGRCAVRLYVPMELATRDFRNSSIKTRYTGMLMLTKR